MHGIHPFVFLLQLNEKFETIDSTNKRFGFSLQKDEMYGITVAIIHLKSQILTLFFKKSGILYLSFPPHSLTLPFFIFIAIAYT